MPYIEVKTTASADEAKRERIKSELGRAISTFPGKSESWLMVNIADNQKMWFRGDDSADIAMVSVDIYGSAQPKACEKMTAQICSLLQKELGISQDKIYVKYMGFSEWGWNGSNF